MTAKMCNSGYRLVKNATIALCSMTLAFWAAPAQAATTNESGQAYVDECDANGVPTPPPWNYELAWHEMGSAWIKLDGVLETSLAGGETENGLPSGRPIHTEVFYYESTSPPGICYALPRGVWEVGEFPEDGPPAYIQLMGIICQGRVTGKACFWDSGVNYISGGLPPSQTLGFGDGIDNDVDGPVTVFAGGESLSDRDQCTGCHMGENVFLVHPDTQLGIPSEFPNAWYEPIVRGGWPQNPPPKTLDGDGGCVSCHAGPTNGGRLPQLSTETNAYCNTVLEGTWGTTMPRTLVPFDPANTTPQFDLDWANYYQLLDDCEKAPTPETSPFVKTGSMDGPAEFNWSLPPTGGALIDVSNPVTQGEGAMQVDIDGYGLLQSASLSSWSFEGVGETMELDVYVPPQGQPNVYWLGAVQLFVTIPSAYMVNTYVGQVELTPGGTGWRTAEFVLSQEVQDALRAPHPDVRFGIAVNTPYGAPPLVLDHLRFEGELQAPAAIPVIVTQHDFERGTTWGGFDSGVVSTGPAGDVAFQGSASLRVDLDTWGDARVWTVPSADLEPGDTVTFEVYVPAGAPVVALQPYIADANWAWAESWNTSFPQGGWISISAVVSQYAALPLREIGVKIYVDAYYSGPVYIDAVRW